MYNIYKVKEVGDKIEIREKKGSYRYFNITVCTVYSVLLSTQSTYMYINCGQYFIHGKSQPNTPNIKLKSLVKNLCNKSVSKNLI